LIAIGFIVETVSFVLFFLAVVLNAVVAVGIVIGAGLAGKFVTLDKAERALPAGALIGVSVCLLAFTTHLPLAYTIMVVIGACGGFFVVPLNALLQERGHGTVGTGHAIAVQNLTEYTAMLVMVAVYTLAVRAGAPITSLAAGFGAALTLSIGTLWLHRRWQTRLAVTAS